MRVSATALVSLGLLTSRVGAQQLPPPAAPAPAAAPQPASAPAPQPAAAPAPPAAPPSGQPLPPPQASPPSAQPLQAQPQPAPVPAQQPYTGQYVPVLGSDQQRLGPEVPVLEGGPTRAQGRPASTGFQAAIRIGASFPFGDATAEIGDQLSARYAWQFPLSLEIGAKVTEAIYIGGYLGVAFGGEGDDPTTENYCRDDDSNFTNDIACSAVNMQLGLEARYSFSPAARWNPWLGFGAGYEAASSELEDRTSNYREEQFASGVTVAKISGGADFRGGIGIGPFGEIALGRYLSSRTEVNGEETFAGAIDNQSFHAWLTFGIRGVANP